MGGLLDLHGVQTQMEQNTDPGSGSVFDRMVSTTKQKIIMGFYPNVRLSKNKNKKIFIILNLWWSFKNLLEVKSRFCNVVFCKIHENVA